MPGSVPYAIDISIALVTHNASRPISSLGEPHAEVIQPSAGELYRITAFKRITCEIEEASLRSITHLRTRRACSTMHDCLASSFGLTRYHPRLQMGKAGLFRVLGQRRLGFAADNTLTSYQISQPPQLLRPKAGSARSWLRDLSWLASPVL